MHGGSAHPPPPCSSTGPGPYEPLAQHPLGVRERALFLVTELSHARAARSLDEPRAMGVSHGQVHAWVKEEGSRIEAETAARITAL